MTINLLLTGGPHDGYMTTIYRDEAPIELRVATKLALAASVEADTVEVSLYRVMRVEPMPIRILGVSAAYTYQGVRPSAPSLVDFSA